MIPVMRGYIKYTDLLDGSVDLADLELIHQAIAASDENQKRYLETAKTLADSNV